MIQQRHNFKLNSLKLHPEVAIAIFKAYFLIVEKSSKRYYQDSAIMELRRDFDRDLLAQHIRNLDSFPTWW